MRKVNIHHLLLRTSLRIVLDVCRVVLSEPFAPPLLPLLNSALFSVSMKGENMGKVVVGEPGGAMRMCEPAETAIDEVGPTGSDTETCRGAVKGLKTGLSWLSRSFM